MHFLDEDGTRWEIRLNMETARLLLEQDIVDLCRIPYDEELLGRALTDWHLIYAILRVACRQRLEELDREPDALGEVLYGATLQRAFRAWGDALANFFWAPAVQQMLRNLWEAQAAADSAPASGDASGNGAKHSATSSNAAESLASIPGA